MSRRSGPTLRRTVAAATASLAVALAPGAPAGAEPGAPRADGADLVALSVAAGELRLSFRGSGQAGADPQALRFTTAGSPAGVVPDDPDFAFLGRPGTPVWSLQDGSPFSTFDTTAVAADAVAGGAVTLELTSVEGPGAFAAYTLSEWGRPALLLDSDGRAATRLPAGKRLGGVVWLFDAAGEYRVTLRATARAGTRTLTDEATYHVTVAGPPAGTPGSAPGQTGGTPATAPATPAPAGNPAAAPPAAGTDPAAGGLTGPAAGTGLPAPMGAAAKAAPGAEAQAPARTAAGAAAAAAPGGRKVISDGHVDMGPQLSGSTLTIKLKDDATSPPTWRDLAGVVLKVTDRALIEVPAGAGYGFLGKAGDKVHLLPQSQQSGIVWPGWNTQHESLVKGTSGAVTWRLTGVTGPGEFKLFRTGSFGAPEVVFDSAKKLPQQLAIAPNTHAHGNWAFTEPGTYRLDVQMSARTTAGRTVADTGTLTIAVGDATDPGSGGTDTGGTGSGDTGAGDDKGAGEPGGGDKGTGAAGGDKGSGGGESGGGSLARTGVDIVSIAGGGVLLLVAGAAAVLATRRRRSEPGHVST